MSESDVWVDTSDEEGTPSTEISHDTSTTEQSSYTEVLKHEGPWLEQGRSKKKRKANKKQEQIKPDGGSRTKRNNTLQITKEKGKERTVKQQFSDKATILTGAKRERSTVLYLRNIYIDGMNEDEVSRSVRKYGTTIGIRVMYCEVIHNRYCTDVVGCKIWVPISHVDHALDFGMWPDNIQCRKWEPKSNVAQK